MTKERKFDMFGQWPVKWISKEELKKQYPEATEKIEENMSLNVKVKKVLSNAVMPIQASLDAAGYDLTAAAEKFRPELTGPIWEYDTGLAFEIPKGQVGLVFPRSSVTTKTTLSLGNCVGVIDSDYRGTIKFQFRNVGMSGGKKYNVGDRIGQIIIIPIPTVSFEEVQELEDSNRGTGGFGSTGV